jgi:NAD(P)-dependent dehydrogenase (short-subunit alcohol dehydrogenase family)
VKRRMAIVTGAASGQGADLAEVLASDGFAVGLIDRDETRLRAVAERIGNAGGSAVARRADVSDLGEVEAALDFLESALGPPWAVAAVAGTAELGFALEVPAQHWRRVMDINWLGVVHVNTLAARRMIEAKHGGRIVNWSSVSVRLPAPGASAYVASKAAIEGFSQALALELAPHQVTVNVIRPGTILTPMLASLDQQRIEGQEQRIPLGRCGTPRDVAGAARFIFGEEASWITGTVITVDGGSEIAALGLSEAEVRDRIEREKKIACDRVTR